MILAFGRPTDMVKRIQIGCIWRPNRCTRPHSCRIQSKHAYRSKQAEGHSKLPRNNPKAAKKKIHLQPTVAHVSNPKICWFPTGVHWKPGSNQISPWRHLYPRVFPAKVPVHVQGVHGVGEAVHVPLLDRPPTDLRKGKAQWVVSSESPTGGKIDNGPVWP